MGKYGGAGKRDVPGEGTADAMAMVLCLQVSGTRVILPDVVLGPGVCRALIYMHMLGK